MTAHERRAATRRREALLNAAAFAVLVGLCALCWAVSFGPLAVPW